MVTAFRYKSGLPKSDFADNFLPTAEQSRTGAWQAHRLFNLAIVLCWLSAYTAQIVASAQHNCDQRSGYGEKPLGGFRQLWITLSIRVFHNFQRELNAFAERSRLVWHGIDALIYSRTIVCSTECFVAGATIMAIDWLDVWKITAILLAGLFGILGTATDTKTKRGTLTKWGKASIVGIVVTTIGGAIAQYAEDAQDAQKSNDLQKTALEVANSTNATVENTQQTLRGLSRLAARIGPHPRLEITLIGSCENSIWKPVCEKLSPQSVQGTPLSLVSHNAVLLKSIDVNILIYSAKPELQSAAYAFTVDPRATPSTILVTVSPDRHIFIKVSGEMRQAGAFGLVSFNDLPGMTMEVRSSSGFFYDANFADFTLYNENGEMKRVSTWDFANVPENNQWWGPKISADDMVGLSFKHKFFVPPRHG